MIKKCHTMIKLHFKVLSCGTRGFQIQIFVDRKKHIYTCSNFSCNIHTIDLATSEANSLQFFFFFFGHRVSCDFIRWFLT